MRVPINWHLLKGNAQQFQFKINLIIILWKMMRCGAMFIN